jgi:hypothetical protein
MGELIGIVSVLRSQQRAFLVHFHKRIIHDFSLLKIKMFKCG